MSMDWIRVGVREEHIRSLFNEDTWKTLFAEFPEVSTVSFIGEKGTGLPTIRGAERENAVEVYVRLTDDFRNEKERKIRKLTERLYRFLSEQKTSDDVLEVKVETEYLGEFSGLVLRDGLEKPTNFWHHQGIPGFGERVTFSADTE